MTKVNVGKSVMEANAEQAATLRSDWQSRGLTVLNLISSPGSGKTALLEQTLEHFRGKLQMAVLVGDVQTENDANRLARHGFPVKQIITNGTCHLEAHMIEKHLPFVDTKGLDLLMIENVGNLVCPSSYDLGEDAKVVLLSTTEGEDKPLKYPAIFRRAEVAILTKTDLLPYLDFDVSAVRHNIDQIHAGIPMFRVSARTGDGLDEWLTWVETKVARKKHPDFHQTVR